MNNNTFDSTHLCLPPPFPPPSLGNASISPVMGGVLHGAWNLSHMSSAAVVYSESTIPTPWPILIIGIFINIIGSLYTMFFTPDNPAESHTKAILPALLASYQIVRTIVASDNMFKAIGGVGGRYGTPSGLVGLFLSTITYVLTPNLWSFMRGLAGLACLLNLVNVLAASLIELMTFGGVDHYGKWFVTGGVCPKVVASTRALGDCTYQYFVGCGTDSLVATDRSNTTLLSGYLQSQDPNLGMGHQNIIFYSEMVIGFITFFIFALTAMAAIAYLVFGVFWCILAIVTNPLRLNKKLPNLEKDDNATETAQQVAFLVLMANIILFSITFPIHYVGETRSIPFVIQESIGNFSAARGPAGGPIWQDIPPMWQNWTGDGVDGSTWTDFFLAFTPADHSGFINFWWKNHGVPAWHWVSFL